MNLPRPPTNIRDRIHAFSLVELLVVVAIIGIMAAMATPSMVSQTGSHDISQAANIISQNISLAQQTAMITGQTAEVRFVQLTSGTKSEWRAIQVWGQKYPSQTLAPINAPAVLPATTALMEGDTFSPLLSKILSSPDIMPQIAGPLLAGKTYKALAICPSGIVVPLPANTDEKRLYYITVAQIQKTSGTNPTDFATISVQPDTGKPIIYRP